MASYSVDPAAEPLLKTHHHGHGEKHKSYSDVLRDAIIGFADGLTVPFALTAGLSAQVILFKNINYSIIHN